MYFIDCAFKGKLISGYEDDCFFSVDLNDSVLALYISVASMTVMLVPAVVIGFVESLFVYILNSLFVVFLTFLWNWRYLTISPIPCFRPQGSSTRSRNES